MRKFLVESPYISVRKEWYRDDLEEAAKKDPLPKLRNRLIIDGVSSSE